MSVLVLAPRSTETDRQLVGAALRRGLRAERLSGWRVPRELRGVAAHVYAGSLFADAVAGELGVALLEVPETWLSGVSAEFLGRRVWAATLAELRAGFAGPLFVKPPNEKRFAARVYADAGALPSPELVDAGALVLVSDVVCFGAEFRAFCLDGRVVAVSRYAVDGDLAVVPADECPDGAEAWAFAQHVLDAEAGRLPSAVVVDVGRIGAAEPGLPQSAGVGGWAVVEANAAWASGGYACDPDAVLEVVLRAAGPAGEVRARDAGFVRAAAVVEG
ncbi:ATP-grasp domain-containing protein [Uniformispora flossi]|uniref:ATP-grasp domain-containing protein n=1 Tax=Uniformispora flossi TaxID=3390723 RepID=UPI003C2D94F6